MIIKYDRLRSQKKENPIAPFAYYCAFWIFFCPCFTLLIKKSLFWSREESNCCKWMQCIAELYHAEVPFFHLLHMQELIGFYATEISLPLVFMCLSTNCLLLPLIKCALNNIKLSKVFSIWSLQFNHDACPSQYLLLALK